MKTITEVQFRKNRGGVFAVFPYEISDSTNVTCYQHIGQHSACTWDINTYSKPTEPEEYQNLLSELKNIGYKLKVITRRSHRKYLKALMTAYNDKQSTL